jgi:hypothetical protein
LAAARLTVPFVEIAAMINKTRRNLLADQIHALIGGFTSNYDFDDWLEENDFCAERDPRHYDDAALGPILERAYCLYSDFPKYTLTGKRKLDREKYRDTLRSILFLRSDLEYEWPVYFYASRFPDLDWLLNKLTFGRFPYIPRPNESYRQWQTHGDHSVWPFIRRSDFDRLARNNCWLHLAVS